MAAGVGNRNTGHWENPSTLGVAVNIDGETNPILPPRTTPRRTTLGYWPKLPGVTTTVEDRKTKLGEPTGSAGFRAIKSGNFALAAKAGAGRGATKPKSRITLWRALNGGGAAA